MKKLVVIGGGPGGNVAALAAARHGCDGVVLVEKEFLGGTCTNRGCIPTKFLLSRLASGESAPEWSRLMAHKNSLVRGLASSIGKSCREAGVEILRGRGRFTGPHSLTVEGEGGSRRLEAESFIVATGSVPAPIAGAPIDGRDVITSTEALDLPSPPSSIIIVGSGAVGAEFAFIFNRAGAKVFIVEALPRLFPGEDTEVHDLFERIFRRLGVETFTGDPLVGLERGEGGLPRALLQSGEKLEAEKILIAGGRSPLTEGLGLEEAGLPLGERGEIAVDGELRTAIPHIFAVGDVTGRLLLAHLASFQGLQAARLACGRRAREVAYHAVPWTIFTTPEIGSVGINESAAAARGLSVRCAAVPWMENIKARIDRATEGFVKLVADGSTGALLGGTVVGSHAAEMIHIVSLAVHRGMTAGELAGTIFAHPGLAETIHDVAEKLQHSGGSISS